MARNKTKTRTERRESSLVLSYRLNTEYDGNRERYKEYPQGQAVETWTVGKVLGRGGHSVVRKHQEEGTGRVRAVKCIEKSGSPFHARELNIMAILNKHEYRSSFVEFLGWFEDRDRLYIAMEYFEKGDLRKHLNKPLREKAVRKITKQVLRGLRVMHDNGIAHRDLKPDNIFVVSTSPVLVKLGDFGISKRIHSDTAYRSRVCTDYYAAPEVLGIDSTSETSVYTNAVDMWSLGCVVYELLAGARLFCSLGDIVSYYYKKGDLLAEKSSGLAKPMSSAVRSFIQALVDPNPEGRPNVVDAASHEWLEEPGIDNQGGTGFQHTDELGAGDRVSQNSFDFAAHLKKYDTPSRGPRKRPSSIAAATYSTSPAASLYNRSASPPPLFNGGPISPAPLLNYTPASDAGATYSASPPASLYNSFGSNSQRTAVGLSPAYYYSERPLRTSLAGQSAIPPDTSLFRKVKRLFGRKKQ